jgi:hypothetical protein
MEILKIQFQNLQLSGHAFASARGEALPAVLFIHGWQSKQDRFYQLAQSLAEQGHFCLTFDLPGHGASEGDTSQLSIADYLDSAVAAYDFLLARNIDQGKIIVIGSSFGSYLGALLTARRPVWKLSLRVPSNYPDEEFYQRQKLRSSEVPGALEWRSQPLDYTASKPLQAVHEFSGQLFIVESEKDEMVPHQTIQNYLDAVSDQSQLTYLLMKGATHNLTGHEDLIEEYNQAVLAWLIQA